MAVSPGAMPSEALLSRRYRIQRKLGSGSLGTVYLARDLVAERMVALKLIRTERLGVEGVARIKEEFRAIAGLHHPQIAVAHDFGYSAEGGLPYYTREYVEGSPLAPGPPRADEPIAPGEYLRPFFDLLETLDYLHAHEILHLDIHAGNLIVASDAKRGSVLIDFGLPRPLRAGGSSALAMIRSSMAPELLRDEPVGPASDIYSVGRLLLYRLTGSPDSEPRLLRDIPGWNPRLTLELERIAGKALEVDTRRRFQSAGEFRDALARALGGTKRARWCPEPGDLTLGRAPELSDIEEALRSAASKRTAALWLVGRAGIGKSRLLTEARLRAQFRGLNAVEVRFLGQSTGEPPLLKALRSGRRGRRALPAWLGPMTVEHGGSTAERASRAAEAYFVEPGPPMALLLDNLERADRESRLLAEALLSACAEQQARGGAERGLALIVTSSCRPKPYPLRPRRRNRVRVLKPLRLKEAESLLLILLRPLKVSSVLARRLARATRGVPLRIRELSRSLHAQFGGTGAIPNLTELPHSILEAMGPVPVSLAALEPTHLEVLRALAILARPASAEEIRAATGLLARIAGKALRQLEREEVLTRSSRGRTRIFHLNHPAAEKRVLEGLSRGDASRTHQRLARFLEKRPSVDPVYLDNLARHLLAGGQQAKGRKVALQAVAGLRRRGLLHNAVHLLSLATATEGDPGWRSRFVEESSSLHEQSGDHEDGIAILEPLYLTRLASLPSAVAIRIRRRLGVHYHRAGRGQEALKLFKEVRDLADSVRDADELVFVDSELAEIYTLRGDYAKAEEACRRGLELLGRARGTDAEFRGRMEVMLRVSLGHLGLRRMALEEAKAELQAASRLARAFGTTGVEALILNNLGIVHNQQNDFKRAQGFYRRAEELLLRSGERRGLIQIACNLATIAAKTGDAVTARDRLEQAAQLLVRYPGRRLEFLLVLARGMVAYFLGDMTGAGDAFRLAIPLGENLGDEQFLTYATMYLAEAEIACGHLGDARKRLHSAAGSALAAGPPVFRRMLHGRLFLLETLLGRDRAAEASRRLLGAVPRTDGLLLEAWNDLFMALASQLRGDPEPHGATVKLLEKVGGTFRRLGIASGLRLTQVALIYGAIHRGDTDRLRSLLQALESAGESHHKFLAVLEPLARGEASLALGELDRAENCLREAAAAIVGLRYLELDSRIEYLHARLAERRGDREGARRYLHRSVYTLDLLAKSLPERLRGGFLAQPRFKPLSDLAARLERPRTPGGTASLARKAGCFQEMIGRSAPMLHVFRSIEQLADQDVPVLIVGETGTGKELVAAAIHRTGPRRNGPFQALHCAALPAELLESELFGHEEGAFTGATERRTGLLDHLQGGTLLLDDVSNLSLECQAKLLRVLESKTFRPLGGLSIRTADVRFLASSSEDLSARIERGAFRADLYYRLRGVEIHVPPLRARVEDISLLGRHFLLAHARRLERTPPLISDEAQRVLEGYGWPGNVRELETVLLRASLGASPGASISAGTLKGLMTPRQPGALFHEDIVRGRDLEDLKREIERVYLMRLFKDKQGDLKAMMAALGMKQATLYRRLRAAGIDVQALRREL